MGTRAVGRGAVHFDGVRVPAEHLLGAEGKGFSEVLRGFDFSRALIGLQCVGAAQASVTAAAAPDSIFESTVKNRNIVRFPRTVRPSLRSKRSRSTHTAVPSTISAFKTMETAIRSLSFARSERAYDPDVPERFDPQ